LPLIFTGRKVDRKNMVGIARPSARLVQVERPLSQDFTSWTPEQWEAAKQYAAQKPELANVFTKTRAARVTTAQKMLDLAPMFERWKEEAEAEKAPARVVSAISKFLGMQGATRKNMDPEEKAKLVKDVVKILKGSPPKGKKGFSNEFLTEKTGLEKARLSGIVQIAVKDHGAKNMTPGKGPKAQAHYLIK